MIVQAGTGTRETSHQVGHDTTSDTGNWGGDRVRVSYLGGWAFVHAGVGARVTSASVIQS